MRMGLGLLIVLSLLLSGIMLAPPADSGNVEVSTNALTPHVPIRIDSDGDFPGIATAGDGNPGTPWVIENWEINGTDAGTCIYVGNTTDYFVIRNCNLYNASGNPWQFFGNAGLVFFNCEYGAVDNITTSINLGYGVYCEYFNNSAVTNSTALSNGGGGFYLGSSNNSLFNNNTGNINVNTGFWISESENITISNNTAISNDLRGISLGNSNNNIIQDNNVSFNEFGIYPYYCENITIENNTLAGNGIYLLGSLIQEWTSHNIAPSNFINGKPVYYEKNQNGASIPADIGQVILANCSNMIVENQNVSDGTTGILLGFSENNTIANNSAWNNHWEGITLLSSSKNNSIINNTILDNYRGIWLYSSGYNTLELNYVSNNDYGIEFGFFSEYNRINNNTVTQNSDTGIKLGSSPNNIIYHNNFIDNFNQGYEDWNNVWNLSYPHGGNYWSDYNGNDSFYGPEQDLIGMDGIGDTNYTVWPGTAFDYYPLMTAWTGQPLGPEVAAPPLALNYTPNGTEESVNSQIQITWNETMNWTSVDEAFNYTDGVTVWSSANGNWLHDSATNISAFTPTDVFAYETQYFVTVNCTATDIIGNGLDQDGNGTGGCWPADVLAWNFTTVDESPGIISTVPANNQIDVDPNTIIRITFSEPMNQSAVEDAFSYTNGTMNFTIANGTEFWNADSTEFTFAPMPILERNQTFIVTINGSLARDLGGRIIGFNYSWTFTTWLEPPAPKVTDTYPPDGTINVAVNTYINIAFDYTMDIDSVQNAFTYTDGNQVWDVGNGTVDWFSSNTLFSFQPNEKLNHDSTYTVRMGTNASSTFGKTLDGNGNGVAELNDDFIFTFTTGVEPPIVSSHYPGKDESDISINLEAVYINFSKPMDTISVTNGISIYPNTPYMPSFSSNQMNLTIVIMETLLEATQYRVTVMGTAIDMAGTKLDGNNDGASGDRFSFTFMTEGGIVAASPPVILSVFPANNATIPVEGVYILVAFSEAMNHTSVESAFSFKNSSAEINGSFTWNPTGKILRFTPTGALEYNTTYTVTVGGTAQDLRGMTLGNTTTWQYLTEAEELPVSMGDWLLYGAIIVLLVMTVMLYMANRSLRMDLRKNRVMLKRAMKRSGLTEEELKTKKVKPDVAEVQETKEMAEGGDASIEDAAEEAIPVETEPVKPELVDAPDK